VGVAVAAALGGGMAIAANATAPQATPTSPPQAPSVFVGVTPVRVLDTRGAAGGPIGVTAPAKLGANSSIDVSIAGVFGIPANAVAVSMNVTLDDDATAKSFLTVYPTGQPRPNASTNNAEPGLVMSNSAIFQLGENGKLTVYNQQGTVNVIFDVTGYFLACAPPSGGGATTTTPGVTTPTTTVPGATTATAPDCTGPTEAPTLTSGALTAAGLAFTGTGWTGCTNVSVTLFGTDGSVTGIVPGADGSIKGDIPIDPAALTPGTNYLLGAAGTPRATCQAAAGFTNPGT